MSVASDTDVESLAELEALDVPSVLHPATKIAINAIASNDNFFILISLVYADA